MRHQAHDCNVIRIKIETYQDGCLSVGQIVSVGVFLLSREAHTLFALQIVLGFGFAKNAPPPRKLLMLCCSVLVVTHLYTF